MALNLYWKDNNQNSYMLGTLYKDNEKYCFDINEKELKKATHKGCFGIGELNLLYNHHISDKLFIFFKRRIPSQDNPNIQEIMRDLSIKEYNEMELLEKTKGVLNTDRYYMVKED